MVKLQFGKRGGVEEIYEPLFGIAREGMGHDMRTGAERGMSAISEENCRVYSIRTDSLPP